MPKVHQIEASIGPNPDFWGTAGVHSLECKEELQANVFSKNRTKVGKQFQQRNNGAELGPLLPPAGFREFLLFRCF